MKIQKLDTVVVISGKDKGTQGKVEKAIPRAKRVVVAGVNMVKKHQKARSRTQQAGIIQMPRPISVSNVMLICPFCKLKTRVGYSVKEGVKSRVCKECGKEIK